MLSLIIPCKSTEQADVQRLLQSIKRQTFKDLEIILSTQGNSEEAKWIGVQRAKGEIIGFLCSDNDFRNSHFLSTLITYAKQPGVTGAYTTYYDHVPQDTMLSRYFALLGANDPLCWWLGKADRSSYTEKVGTRLVSFTGQIPSLGDNGCFFKASLLRGLTIAPESFGSCMCLSEDLRRIGHSRYWVVSEQKLWHRTGEDTLDYFRRRYRYVKNLYFQKHAIRRWRMVETTDDWFKVITFCVASLLLFPHFITAFRGYHRVRDVAWFLHPFVCFGLVFTYGAAWIMSKLPSSSPALTVKTPLTDVSSA